jgi:hypothetical protein
MLGSDHCDDLYVPAPHEELVTNFARNQTIIPCQRLITSPDLVCYSVYVDPSLYVVVCLSC